MGFPGAAATAPNIDVRVAAREIAHPLAELGRVSVFEMADLAEFVLLYVAAFGRNARTRLIQSPGFQRGLELERVRTVDAVEGGLASPACASTVSIAWLRLARI